MIPYNKKLVHNARTLRKNMTPEEKHLWYDFLKKLPVNVRRQHNIENYIVDFYIAKEKIVIELDGRQHGEEKHVQSDQIRDEFLSTWGIKVLRFSNLDIHERFDIVKEEILEELGLDFADLKVE